MTRITNNNLFLGTILSHKVQQVAFRSQILLNHPNKKIHIFTLILDVAMMNKFGQLK